MRRVALILCLGLSACATAPADPGQPGPATPKAMVAAANPLAVDAGLRVLKAGGSAVDAAVAVQSVLGLVEPQSSGLGGGAFMTYYDAKTRKITIYDGREVAPKAALPDQFLDAAGDPLPFFTAVLGGTATGVPGALAMLDLAQKEHGKLAWGELFVDAEKLADQGFIVSPRLSLLANSIAPQAHTPDANAYFTKPDGTRIRTGDLLVNKDYAQTLRLISAQRSLALLNGPLSAAIVQRLGQGPAPSAMTLDDLASYKPQAREPLCQPYRNIYVVCVPPPPSSGVALLQALLMLEHTDIAVRKPLDPKAWLRLAEAERLMYADRDRYVGDPAFVPVPVSGLLNPAYVQERAGLIGDRVGPAPTAGTPPQAVAMGPDRTPEPGGTSHFVVVDAQGNVVSMTTTVESLFGTGRMVGGFFLNNQLTDFSFSPVDGGGKPVANAVAGGKRPRSRCLRLLCSTPGEGLSPLLGRRAEAQSCPII